MTLSEYYDLLAAHDWHHDKSDDQRAYERGLAEYRQLCTIASSESDVAFNNLFVAYQEHVTLGRPKPERPT